MVQDKTQLVIPYNHDNSFYALCKYLRLGFFSVTLACVRCESVPPRTYRKDEDSELRLHVLANKVEHYGR